MSPSNTKNPTLRSEIADSWKRTRMTGLTPTSEVRTKVMEFDTRSRLLAAAEPVMKALEQEISGANVGALLADKSAVIIGRYFGTDNVARGADRVGAHVGAEFTEETSGTNAIATPFETHQPVAIEGEEHYLQSMKVFRCVGLPIYHPLTNRFEGVFDLMAEGEIEQKLLRFISARILRDIQDQLVSDVDSKTAAAIAAFHALKSRTDDALILFGEDYTLNNKTSLELLDGSDHRDLAALSVEVHAGESVNNVTLSSGRSVAIRVSSLSSAGAKLLRVTPTKRSRSVIPRNITIKRGVNELVETQISRCKLQTGHVLIAGEHGSGRTFVAERIAETHSSVRLPISTTTPPESCLAAIEELLTQSPQPDFVILEHIERVSAPMGEAFAELLRDEAGPRFLITQTVQAGELVEGYLQSLCMSHVELKPLRALMSDFEAISHNLLAELAPDSKVRLSAEVLDVCKTLPWPGNFSELRTVLKHALEQASETEILLSHLPERYQVAHRPHTRKLSELEVAEKMLIEAALSRNSGNKVHAAHELGISRSTLYARLKYFGLK